jgi:hypothetical protein
MAGPRGAKHRAGGGLHLWRTQAGFTPVEHAAIVVLAEKRKQKLASCVRLIVLKELAREGLIPSPREEA